VTLTIGDSGGIAWLRWLILGGALAAAVALIAGRRIMRS
jgi:hypothetical protein